MPAHSCRAIRVPLGAQPVYDRRMRKLSLGWTIACVLALVACEQRGERRAANGTTTPTMAGTAASANAPATTAPAPAPSAAPTIAPAITPTIAPAASASAVAKTCEVEIFGTVDVPNDAPKTSKVIVTVAQDDCLAADAHVLGHIPAAPSGGFVIEVFPKWGTDVTICGALEKDDGTAEYFGKAVNKDAGGKFHAEAEGEVTFNEVKIKLAKGAAKRFPREAKPGGGG